MKTKSFLLLLILALILSCKSQTQKIEITPTIFIKVPQKSITNITNPKSTQKKWEIAFDDDYFEIFRNSINELDSANNPDRKMVFKKNINSFLRVFDLNNLDSTFTYKDMILQSDLSFDYLNNGNKYKFFGRFLVYKENFIAFCFQTPFPFDNYSKRTKDRLFNSIDIK